MKKRKGLDQLLHEPGTPGRKPPGRVNTVKGSKRYGQKFNVVHEDGKRFHVYKDGTKIADTQAGGGSRSLAKPRTIPPGTQPDSSARPTSLPIGKLKGTAGGPYHGQSKPNGVGESSETGAFVNTAKGNPRYGRRFDVVSKGGTRYHKYSGGMIADIKAGSATTPVPKAPPPLTKNPPPTPEPAVTASEKRASEALRSRAQINAVARAKRFRKKGKNPPPRTRYAV